MPLTKKSRHLLREDRTFSLDSWYLMILIYFNKTYKPYIGIFKKFFSLQRKNPATYVGKTGLFRQTNGIKLEYWRRHYKKKKRAVNPF